MTQEPDPKQPPKQYPYPRVRVDGPPQRKIGRLAHQSKYDEVDTGSLIRDVAEGVPVEIACHIVGISRETFRLWLDEVPEFSHRLAAEKRRVVLEKLALIAKASRDNDWKAHAWFLERVYRDQFAPPPINAPAFGVQQNFVITYEKAKEIEAMRTELLPEIEKRLGLTDGKTNGEEASGGQG